MKAYVILMACQLMNCAWAQATGPVSTSIGSTMSLGQKNNSGNQILIVEPSGKISKAPKSTSLQLQTKVLTEPTTASEILRRNGLSEDSRTVDMLKRLNPEHDFSAGPLPVGTKIDIFAPKFDDAKSMTRLNYQLTFDGHNVGSLAVHGRVAEAEKIKQVAYKLSSSSFQSEDDIYVHRQAVHSIDSAAKVINAKANNLAGSDLAVIQYQLDLASRNALLLNDRAIKNIKISPKDVQIVKEAAAPMQQIASRISSGQTPLPVRRVKVSLYKQNTTEDVKGMQVYVLPAGIIDNPDLFLIDEIMNYLTRFSPSEETSPNVQDIPVFNARIWVGPKFKFLQMAELVKQRKITRFLPFNSPSHSTSIAEIVFRSPDDLIDLK